MNAGAIRYQAYYCEENAWWLCRDPGLAALRREVVFVSNAGRACLLARQRAGAPPRGEVIWDYHVFVAVAHPEGWRVWDPDTTLGLPVAADRYLVATFAGAGLASPLAPRFRVVAAERFVSHFATDRSHMRDAAGGWLQPPPPWPPPRGPAAPGPMNLMAYVDVTAPGEGERLDLAGLRARYAGDATGQKV